MEKEEVKGGLNWEGRGRRRKGGWVGKEKVAEKETPKMEVCVCVGGLD